MTQLQSSALKKTGMKLAQALTLAGVLAVSGQAAAQTSSKAEAPLWYVQGQGSVLQDLEPSVTAKLGGPVSLTGTQSLSSGRAASLAVGRQMSYVKDNGDAVPLRLEVEAWAGRYDRSSVSLGMLTVKPNDRIDADVQFLNAAVRLMGTDEKYKATNSPAGQLWLKVGIGYGSVSYPDGSGNAGCRCLRSAKGSGASQQLQVSYERYLNEDIVVFGQVGRVWLPSAASALVAGSQTSYERLTVDAASLGLRYLFR